MFDLLPGSRRAGKELAHLRDEIDNLFNRFFDMDIPISRRFFGDGEWTPRVDVVEGKEDITVKAELPGCEIEDIDVKLDRRRLTISGEKKQEKEEQAGNVHRVERAYGSFTRVLDLPADVDQEAIEATYKKGILKLVFTKTRASEARTITIKTG
jgi:HSP20 family protein